MSTQIFKSSLNDGNKNEEFVINYIETHKELFADINNSQFYFYPVNYKDNPKAQHMGIDAAMWCRDYDWNTSLQWIEIKRDRDMYENFFIESGIKRKGKNWCRGWLYTYKSDYLIYYNDLSCQLYIIDWQSTQKYCIEKLPKIPYYNEREKCPASMRLLPIARAKKMGFVIMHIDTRLDKVIYRNNENGIYPFKDADNGGDENEVTT